MVIPSALDVTALTDDKCFCSRKKDYRLQRFSVKFWNDFVKSASKSH